MLRKNAALCRIFIKYYNFSKRASQSDPEASEGMRQSARGDSETDPTFTPSGMQFRLNCCEKNRL